MSPSRSSTASNSPVEAPEGTARAAEGAVLEDDVDFDSGIAAGIQDLARLDVFDNAHGCLLILRIVSCKRLYVRLGRVKKIWSFQADRAGTRPIAHRAHEGSIKDYICTYRPPRLFDTVLLSAKLKKYTARSELSPREALYKTIRKLEMFERRRPRVGAHFFRCSILTSSKRESFHPSVRICLLFSEAAIVPISRNSNTRLSSRIPL